jgi:predicted membrane chloride channel (bestrophin family)
MQNIKVLHSKILKKINKLLRILEAFSISLAAFLLASLGKEKSPSMGKTCLSIIGILITIILIFKIKNKKY